MPVNRQIHLVARPTPGALQPAKLFKLVEAPFPRATQAGQVVLKTLYLSLDPTMRGWMTYDTYLPAVPLNSVMRGGSVAQVIESKSEKFKVGDLVQCFGGWQEYVLTTEKECSRVVLPPGITPADQISLQLTGLTAMVGIFNIGLGNFKPGSTVLVSGAAGSTGSIAGQVYKHALGCRVVGTAGGPEKCNFVKQVLGFDECVDYKDPNYESNLKAACPKGIKEYFDNVGSRTLELALDLLTQGGRVVLCGGIAEYESASPKGPSNYLNLIVKRLRMEGFVFTDHARSFPSHMKKLHQLIGSGKLKIVNDVRTGLENAGDSLKDLFAGKNFGKMMVKL